MLINIKQKPTFKQSIKVQPSEPEPLDITKIRSDKIDYTDQSKNHGHL